MINVTTGRTRLAVGAAVAALLGLAGFLTAPEAAAVEDGSPATGELQRGTIPVIDNQPADTDRWIVRVVSKTRECSGAVFADFWVVTAKHCVVDIGEDADEQRATRDDYPLVPVSLDSRYADGTRMRAEVAQVHVVPQGDVALLRLTAPYRVVTDAAGAPARPRGPGIGLVPPAADAEGVIFGFGHTCKDCPASGTPKGAGVTVKLNYTDWFGQPALAFAPDDATVNLEDPSDGPADPAGDQDGATVLYRAGKSRAGDSGGPLVVDGQIVGVGSTFRYTLLSAHADWILSVLNL